MRERERELNKICEALRKLSENDASVKKYADIFERMLNKVEYKKIWEYFTRLRWTAITAGKMKEIEEEWWNVRIFAWWKTMIDTDEKNIPEKDIIRVPSVVVQSRWIIDFIYYDKPFSFKQEMWAYTHENKITTKYLYYYLKTNAEYFRNIWTQMWSMPQISLWVTENYEIPVPSLEEQERIVNILDKFEKLVNDISEWLPAEIELRKKQYEYYRDKLLTFK